MANISAPLASSELTSFAQLSAGKRLTPFKSALEGKHVAFIAKADDYKEVIFADVFNRNMIFRRQVTANDIAIHPTKPHVALISNNKVQIYDVESHERVVTVNFEHQLAFWRFVDENNIILVSDRSVFRWNYTTAGSEPKKVFDTQGKLLNQKVVDAGMDKKQEYLYILSHSIKKDGDFQSLIYSMHRLYFLKLGAYQMAFVSWTIGANPKQSTLLVIGKKVPKTGIWKLIIRQITCGGIETYQKKAVDIPFSDAGDFPVAIRVSEKYGLIHLLSKNNNIFAFELESASLLYHSVIKLSLPAKLVAAWDQIGGYTVLTQDFNLVAISVNDMNIVPFMVHNGKHDLALKFATRCALPGAEELAFRRFEQLFQNDRDYFKAAELAAATPVLRTPETLRLFRQLPAVNGTSAANVYFNVILKNANAVLNKIENDAIDFASDSRNNDVVHELITYFVEHELHDCFSTMLYKCFDLLKPDYVMELAWKHRVTDYAMPYSIQVVKNMNTRMERLEELKVKGSKQDEGDIFAPTERMAIGYTPNFNSFA